LSAPDATTGRLQAALAGSLGLFAAGVQVHEVFATAGGWLTTVLAIVVTLRRPGAKQALEPWRALDAYLVWCLVVPLLAGRVPTGSGVARLWDVLMLPGVGLACTLVSRRALERIAFVAGAVLLLSCGAAALQYVGAWPGSETFSMLWWAQVPTDRVYEPVPGSSDRFMAGGLLLHRLRFANVTACLTVLAAAGAFRVSRHRWWFILLSVVGLVSVAVFPHARAATVALVVALLVVAWLGAPDRRLAALVTGLVVAIALVTVTVVPSVRARFSAAFESDGASDRTLLLEAGLAAVKSAPLAGLGPGRFKPKDWLPADAPEALKQHQGKAHNQFVTLAAEAGLLAPVLFLLGLGLLAARAVKALPATTGHFGVLVCFVALSALHDPLFHAEASLALFGSLGAGLGLGWRREETP
jgi:O-antigen ligase